MIESGDTCVLVDCGFSLKETESRLSRLDKSPSQINAILVTHEHNDHIGGVGPLARKYGMPVFLTTGTWQASRVGDVPDLRLIKSSGNFVIGDITVSPVAVPHDAREPVQFVFKAGGKNLGVLTDIGSLTDAVICHYANCDALVLEANHCREMLERGPYPPSLKMRVGSDLGHLSNEQSAQLLNRFPARLEFLVLAHLSEQNNSVMRVKEALQDHWEIADNILFACQQQGFDWLELN